MLASCVCVQSSSVRCRSVWLATAEWIVDSWPWPGGCLVAQSCTGTAIHRSVAVTAVPLRLLPADVGFDDDTQPPPAPGNHPVDSHAVHQEPPTHAVSFNTL